MLENALENPSVVACKRIWRLLFEQPPGVRKDEERTVT
jgi:hypothetical protein